MRFLLDTHAVLYFLAGDPRLADKAREIIDDTSCEKFFSLASMWEIAVKISIGKLTLATGFDVVPKQLTKWNIRELAIELPHLSQVSSLPLHHRDPFDRLIVAQCLVGNFTLVSADFQLDAYRVQRIW